MVFGSAKFCFDGGRSRPGKESWGTGEMANVYGHPDGNLMDLGDVMTLEEEAEYNRLRDMEAEQQAPPTQTPGEFLAALAVEEAKVSAEWEHRARELARSLSILAEQYEETMHTLTAIRPGVVPDGLLKIAHTQRCHARLALAVAGFGKENER